MAGFVPAPFSIWDLRSLLETLDSIGIEEAVLAPEEEKRDPNTGACLLASNRTRSVVVADQVGLPLLEEVFGIGSVKGLLSRLELFDRTKACKFEISKDEDGVVEAIKVSQGRKKTEYRCLNPEVLLVPSAVMDEQEDSWELCFTQADISEFQKASRSIMMAASDKEKAQFKITVDKLGEAEITIADGDYDSFRVTMKASANTDKGLPETSWDISTMIRCLKAVSAEAAENGLGEGSEEALCSVKMTVAASGIAFMTLGEVEFMLIPDIAGNG